jgi:hypothetical protein
VVAGGLGLSGGGLGWGDPSSLSRVRGIRVGDSLGVGWSERVCWGSGGVWGGGWVGLGVEGLGNVGRWTPTIYISL